MCTRKWEVTRPRAPFTSGKCFCCATLTHPKKTGPPMVPVPLESGETDGVLQHRPRGGALVPVLHAEVAPLALAGERVVVLCFQFGAEVVAGDLLARGRGLWPVGVQCLQRAGKQGEGRKGGNTKSPIRQMRGEVVAEEKR